MDKPDTIRECSSHAATVPGVAFVPRRVKRARARVDQLPVPFSQYEVDGEPDIIDCVRAVLFGRTAEFDSRP